MSEIECQLLGSNGGKPKGRNYSDADIERVIDKIIAAIPDDSEDYMKDAEQAILDLRASGALDVTDDDIDVVFDRLTPFDVRIAIDERTSIVIDIDKVNKFVDSIISNIPDDAEDLVTAAERVWEKVTDDGREGVWTEMSEYEQDAVRKLLDPQFIREAMDEQLERCYGEGGEW